MKKKINLTPADARVPAALNPFLAVPDRPMRYRWWTRFGDHSAGRSDRPRPVRDSQPELTVADTPWLRRLTADCANAIAAGRARSEALVSIIDRERAMVIGDITAAKLACSSLPAKLAAVAATPVDDGIVGTGEAHSSSEERLQRRHLELGQQEAALNRQLHEATHKQAEAEKTLAVLEQERLSHWVVLQERTRHLTEYYQRRAATYTRGLENRRRGQFWIVPTLIIPDWAAAELGTGSPNSLAPIVSLASTH